MSEVSDRTRARVLASGELMATELGARFLNAQGIEASWWDARTGLKAQPRAAASARANFLSATCEFAPDPALQRQLASCSGVVVTQGFIASDGAGDTVLLGRGGSDTSAAYLAAKLAAQQLEIWTDVPGMFSANPHHTPQARLLRSLHYDEAQEIASSGAKVLHPRCILPAKSQQIPIVVYATQCPQIEGTHISADGGDGAAQVKAVCMKKGITLVALGYLGSERTTRRWVADAKRRWRREHGRRTRPWIPEPGLWMQWDYGDGPMVDGRSTVLFCAWLAWSRYRVVVPLRDKTLPSVVIGLDRALRRFDGVPTYALTDNERTVSVDHVCGIAVRNPQIVQVARHYGLTITTCVPADPQSKGGSEATVRIAKADLVPTDHNLRSAYGSFGELEAACEEWMAHVNTRQHRATMEPPVLRLAEEHERLHRLPRLPHMVCFGETRKVSWQSVISVGGARYSVPHSLIDERVWARADGEEVLVWRSGELLVDPSK